MYRGNYMPAKKKSISGKLAPNKTAKKKAVPKKTSTKPKPAAVKTRKKGAKRAVPVHQPSCIVSIGASAGGLEALEGFIPNLATPSSMGFVIIQHLAPK